MKFARNRFARWLSALAILLGGIASSFLVAGWLQSALGLPSFVVVSRHGSPSDLVLLTLGGVLLIAYLYFVPKLFRIDHHELSRMLRGE
jgi:hypothetical protein